MNYSSKFNSYKLLYEYSCVNCPTDIISLIASFLNETLIVIIDRQHNKLAIFDNNTDYKKNIHLFSKDNCQIQRIVVTNNIIHNSGKYASGHCIINRSPYSNIYINGWVANISHATYIKPIIVPKYYLYNVLQTVPDSYQINTIYNVMLDKYKFLLSS